MTRTAVLPGLDPATHTRSELHSESCIWLEKNCYIDIWIEVLNALKLNPIAMLPFTIAIDFEGDQWTFFKPVHSELRDLYGVDVQELNVWRPLIEHAIEHMGAGKMISTEADAFWLPDTAGTDYRRQHTKTTIVLNDLDVEARQLGYFHNAGYYRLAGEDFARTFRLDMPSDPTFMPLFAETIHVSRVDRKSESALASLSIRHFRHHVHWRPQFNPIRRFQERLERELPNLQQCGLAFYHSWAFGTIRQLGAAAELTSAYLNWLDRIHGWGFAPTAKAFEAIAQHNKTLILKAARAVNSRKPLDMAPLQDAASLWDRGMREVTSLLDSNRC